MCWNSFWCKFLLCLLQSRSNHVLQRYRHGISISTPPPFWAGRWVSTALHATLLIDKSILASKKVLLRCVQVSRCDRAVYCTGMYTKQNTPVQYTALCIYSLSVPVTPPQGEVHTQPRVVQLFRYLYYTCAVTIPCTGIPFLPTTHHMYDHSGVVRCVGAGRRCMWSLFGPRILSLDKTKPLMRHCVCIYYKDCTYIPPLSPRGEV